MEITNLKNDTRSTDWRALDPEDWRETFNIEDLDVGYDSLYDRLDAYANHGNLSKLKENSEEFDYSYHGINGKEDIYGSQINDIIYAHGGDDRLYLTPGFDLILTGAGKDTLYITAVWILLKSGIVLP